MKKVLLSLLSVLTLHTAMAQNSQKTSRIKQSAQAENTANLVYSFNLQTAAYTPLTGAISLNNNSIWDDPSFTIPMPFGFTVQGQQVDSLLLDGLGGNLVGITNGAATVTIVAPFDVDLIDRGYDSSVSLSPLSYKVEGSAGSRILKIEWKEVGSYAEYNTSGGILAMYISFQTWIYEGSNIIEYRYGANTISNPLTFYDGDDGALIGTAIFDGINAVANLLTGAANAPSLSLILGPITGTPANGTVYRFTPLGGGSSSVRENSLSHKLSAWPNPVSDVLNLELKNQEQAELSLYNMHGQKAKQQRLTESRSSLDLSDLPAGAYLIRMEGQAGSMRIIKR